MALLATVSVEEAERPPKTVRLDPTDEEAVETNPARVESPAMFAVPAIATDDEALNGPLTDKGPTTVDDADTM